MKLLGYGLRTMLLIFLGNIIYCMQMQALIFYSELAALDLKIYMGFNF